jgi:hypothetical protein
MNTCESCHHNAPSNTYAIACYRSKRMASGIILKAHPGVGFPAEFEIGHEDLYEGRASGDCCSPDRRHWRARA